MIDDGPPPTVERLLIEFFQRNPQEELSLEDAITKFGRAPTVRNVLGRLVGEGMLERISIYRLREPGS